MRVVRPGGWRLHCLFRPFRRLTERLGEIRGATAGALFDSSASNARIGYSGDTQRRIVGGFRRRMFRA